MSQRSTTATAARFSRSVDQIEQGHRLLTQRMYDMAIIDDVTAFVGGGLPPPPQRHHRRRAQEAVEPVVVKVNPQAMPDQPRGGRVEHPTQDEATAGRHRHDLLLEVGHTPLGQVVQSGALHLDPLAVVGILPAENLVDEAPIGIEGVEVFGAAHQQGVLQRPFEMAMRALDGAILMGNAGVVARRRHPIVTHEAPLALRQVLLGFGVQIAEGRRQAVAAVLLRHTTKRPKRILQALGERNETLPSEHDTGVGEA